MEYGLTVVRLHIAVERSEVTAVTSYPIRHAAFLEPMCVLNLLSLDCQVNPMSDKPRETL